MKRLFHDIIFSDMVKLHFVVELLIFMYSDLNLILKYLINSTDQLKELLLSDDFTMSLIIICGFHLFVVLIFKVKVRSVRSLLLSQEDRTLPRKDKNSTFNHLYKSYIFQLK